MSTLHQIYEDDLATLEREIPKLVDALLPQLDNGLRTKIRAIQSVIVNVRWNYGPGRLLKEIPADSTDETSGGTPPDQAR